MPEHNTDSRTGLPARRPLKPGEWACVEGRCSQINQESSFVCEGCGKHKPKPKGRAAAELGKQAAEKSKGLFSAEDWMCTKCGNVNWARRNTCNVCNAKKLGDAEQRTGFGGGYNDRQNVEYVKREYDEEFDEFGRKKKRKGETGDSRRDESRDEDRPKLGDVDIDKAFSLEPGYAEDEEEEEDDGDDADLAKYDLTADPELKVSIDITKLQKKTSDEKKDKSDCSSECSCSCSGGECSCEESEEERPPVKKSRSDRDREHDKR
uniref:Zinc finger Ran-binding domain-containing protein 2 n=1 Tax=Bursaphelenchus xylophilus TaxID=6326 RepID=A0A1I7SWY6_BURXY